MLLISHRHFSPSRTLRSAARLSLSFSETESLRRLAREMGPVAVGADNALPETSISNPSGEPWDIMDPSAAAGFDDKEDAPLPPALADVAAIAAATITASAAAVVALVMSVACCCWIAQDSEEAASRRRTTEEAASTS